MASTGGVVFFPFLFGKELQEGIETFVHPAPLAFVGVDDHGKPVVADFMDNHTNESVFGIAAVGAIFFGSRTIEGNHRVFHPENRSID